MDPIIFDYNRTLNDPDNYPDDIFVPGTLPVLNTLKEKGFTLFMYCKGGEGRTGMLNQYSSLFQAVCVVPEKSFDSLKAFCDANSIDPKAAWMVGDRVMKEIAFGNALGMKTVWLKKGKFAEEGPKNKEEEPEFTIISLAGLLKITGNL